MAREGWFEKPNWKVIRAHMPFSVPIHEDRGMLHIHRRGMRFEGENSLNFEIAFHDIVDVHLGFDDLYKRRFEQGFGALGKPLRITHVTSGKKEDVYLYIGYSFVGRRSENAVLYPWFEKMRPPGHERSAHG